MFILAMFTQLFYHLSVKIVLLILVAILLKSNMFKKGEKKEYSMRIKLFTFIAEQLYCTVRHKKERINPDTI